MVAILNDVTQAPETTNYPTTNPSSIASSANGNMSSASPRTRFEIGEILNSDSDSNVQDGAGQYLRTKNSSGTGADAHGYARKSSGRADSIIRTRFPPALKVDPAIPSIGSNTLADIPDCTVASVDKIGAITTVRPGLLTSNETPTVNIDKHTSTATKVDPRTSAEITHNTTAPVDTAGASSRFRFELMAPSETPAVNINHKISAAPYPFPSASAEFTHDTGASADTFEANNRVCGELLTPSETPTVNFDRQFYAGMQSVQVLQLCTTDTCALLTVETCHLRLQLNGIPLCCMPDPS